MVRLVVTEQDLTRILRQVARDPGVTERFALGVARRAGQTDLLARSTPGAGEGVLLVRSVAEPDADDPSQLRTRMDALLDGAGEAAFAVGLLLAAGPGHGRGGVCGRVRTPRGAVLPLDAVQVMGPGLPILILGRATTDAAVAAAPRDDDGIYDRLIGALSAGTFARLKRLRMAVIGCGGTGSIMAAGMARLLGREGLMTLMDPDMIQTPNLGHWNAAQGLRREDIGRPKAEMLARYLRGLPDPPTIKTVARDVLAWESLIALKDCDLWAVCVDNARARFHTACLASLYLRPLLDVATGVHLGASPTEHARRVEGEPVGQAIPPLLRAAGPRVQGADIRLVLPGSEEAGCLFCLGGAGDLRTVPSLRQGEEDRPALALPAPFWKERAGSLWSLNGEAVGRAQRLLLALVQANVSDSVHLQLEDTGDGLGEWQRVAPERRYACPVCRLRGMADGGLGRIGRTLADLRLEHP